MCGIGGEGNKMKYSFQSHFFFPGIFYLAENDELPGEFVIKDKSTQYKFLIGKKYSLSVF